MILYVSKSPTCIIYNFRPGWFCFDITVIIPHMQKIYFDKQKTVFCVKKYLPLLPCASLHHSKMEMMGASWIYGHMTKHVHDYLDTRGGSTYPLAHLTSLSPIAHASLNISLGCRNIKWDPSFPVTGLSVEVMGTVCKRNVVVFQLMILFAYWRYSCAVIAATLLHTRLHVRSANTLLFPSRLCLSLDTPPRHRRICYVCLSGRAVGVMWPWTSPVTKHRLQPHNLADSKCHRDCRRCWLSRVQGGCSFHFQSELAGL